MEVDVRKQYPRSKPIDIKKKALGHLKGEQERLNYVGGRYLTVPIAAVFLTVMVNVLMTDNNGQDQRTIINLLWVSLIILLFLFLTPLVEHYLTEKKLYKTTCMIEILEQQIRDAEE